MELHKLWPVHSLDKAKDKQAVDVTRKAGCTKSLKQAAEWVEGFIPAKCIVGLPEIELRMRFASQLHAGSL